MFCMEDAVDALGVHVRTGRYILSSESAHARRESVQLPAQRRFPSLWTWEVRNALS